MKVQWEDNPKIIKLKAELKKLDVLMTTHAWKGTTKKVTHVGLAVTDRRCILNRDAREYIVKTVREFTNKQTQIEMRYSDPFEHIHYDSKDSEKITIHQIPFGGR